ncbi:MAG: hypothetical protein LAO18_03245 [Acidobacteriia bacterium]|jgi:hypothetical protein|nr:hypothetical protein [Terriglobia bacterium]
MSLPEEYFPALTTDAARNPESARLLQLLAQVDKALAERPDMTIKLSTKGTEDVQK